MARADLLSILYTRKMSSMDFNFEALQPSRGLYDLLYPYDIRYLKSITSHPKLTSKIGEKTKLIKEVMEERNFKKMAQGTNRICFKHYTYSDIVAKVALDDVGLTDNPAEYRNQNILKPFICKEFELSEFGEVGLFERVEPITSVNQFLSIAGDVFDLLNIYIDGKYVLEDIGSDYFLNYGIRKGFGPVLLDYPYLYEIDGSKLICNNRDPLSPTGYCMGEVDFDAGYNNLVCTKCGKRYLAKELRKKEKDSGIIIQKSNKGGLSMKITIKRGDNIISERVVGKNMKEVNFIPTKSLVKVTVSGGKRNVEEVENKPEEQVSDNITSTLATPKPVETANTIKVTAEYRDNSERPNRGNGNRNNNNKKHPGRNDPDYYNRNNYNNKKPNNHNRYNSNTSVSNIPSLEGNIYRNTNISTDNKPVEEPKKNGYVLTEEPIEPVTERREYPRYTQEEMDDEF